MRRTAAFLIALTTAVSATCVPMPSRAQVHILDLDPSIRSAAMGGASTAMFWADDPNAWANPALLGFVEGFRYLDGSTSYGPGMNYWTHRMMLGYAGLGLASAGRPISAMGGHELELLSLGGAYDERARAWEAGISMSRLGATLLRHADHDVPAILRHVDLALGYAENVVELSAPSYGGESAVSRDLGLLVRASLRIPGSSALRGGVDVAYGFAALNANDAKLSMSFGEIPLARRWRNGVALRMTFESTRPPTHWLAAGFEPLVSLGGAYDAVHYIAHDAIPFGNDEWGIDEWGGEVALANALFLRFGGFNNESGDAESTWGIGLGVPIGLFGGFRYDHANVGRPVGLSDVRRDGWTL